MLAHEWIIRIATLQIVPAIILITRRNTLIFVHVYRRERGRRGERESRERAFWLLKNPASWFPSINPTFSQMNNRQVCQYVEAAGRKYEMHVNNALEPAEYPNEQLDLRNEHSLWFRAVFFFPSWIRARMRLVNILTFLPYCASNISFISISLSENHRVNVYSYLLYIFSSTYLTPLLMYIRKAVSRT